MADAGQPQSLRRVVAAAQSQREACARVGHPHGWAVPSDFFIKSSKGRSIAGIVLPGGMLQIRLALAPGTRQVVLDWTAAYCCRCDSLIPNATKNVANFRAHATRCDKAKAEVLMSRPMDELLKAPSSLLANSVGVSVQLPQAAKHVVKDLLAAYVAQTGVPFSAVDNESFRALFAFVSGGALPPSRHTVSRSVKAHSDAVKVYVSDLLQRARGYSLTCDGWTSRGNIAYYGVTWCGIDPDTMEHVNLLLDLHPLPVDHDARALHSKLTATASKYNLRPERLVSVVGDGAKAQMNAMRDFCMAFKGKDVSLHCASHLVQLIARAPLRIRPIGSGPDRAPDLGNPLLLHSLRRVIDVGAGVASFFSASPGAAQMLRLRVEQHNQSLGSASASRIDSADVARLTCWALIRLAPTRWDGAHRMLQRLDLLKDPVRSALTHLGTRSGQAGTRAKQLKADLESLLHFQMGGHSARDLSRTQRLRELIKVMEIQHSWTLQTQKNGWAAAMMYYPIMMQVLQLPELVAEQPDDPESGLKSQAVREYVTVMASDAQRRVDLRSNDGLFIPQLCAMYLYYGAMTYLKRLGVSESSTIARVEFELTSTGQQLLPEEALTVVPRGGGGGGGRDTTVETDDSGQPPRKRQRVDSHDSSLAAMMSRDSDLMDDEPEGDDGIGPMTPLQQEFVDYKAAVSTQLAAALGDLRRRMDRWKADEEKADRENRPHSRAKPQLTLDEADVWWKNHKEKFPLLFELALHYLSQTISSAESERVFSVAGHHASARRTRLNDDSLGALVRISKNRAASNALVKEKLDEVLRQDPRAPGAKVALQILGDTRRPVPEEEVLAGDCQPTKPVNDSELRAERHLRAAEGQFVCNDDSDWDSDIEAEVQAQQYRPEDADMGAVPLFDDLDAV